MKSTWPENWYYPKAHMLFSIVVTLITLGIRSFAKRISASSPDSSVMP